MNIIDRVEDGTPITRKKKWCAKDGEGVDCPNGNPMTSHKGWWGISFVGNPMVS